MATDYIGIAGLLLILAGWAWEFWQTLKSDKAGVPLSFALLYGAGSLLLTLHSMELGDTVFIILNAAATLIAAAMSALGGAAPEKIRASAESPSHEIV